MKDNGTSSTALAAASVPEEMKGLRACIPCLLVKTFRQFYDEGCENCTFLDLKDDRGLVADATTEDFRGMVSVLDPKKSWVSRWIRVSNLVPGCYAMKVEAQLSQALESILEENNVPNLGKLSQQD